MADSGQDTIKLWLTSQLTYYLTDPPQKTDPRLVNFKLLMLMVRIIRDAEREYLSPIRNVRSYKEATRILFGVHTSPLPRICRMMGLDVTKERVKILEWLVAGKVGDPIFGFLKEPKALQLIKKGAKVSDIYKLLQGEENARKEEETESHVRDLEGSLRR